MKRLLLAFLLSAASFAASAHHSIAAMYARESPVTLEGVVERFDFHNPHPVIHLRVTRDTGAVEAWAIEWSSTRRLAARGYSAGTLQPGDRIVVTGGPARNGSKGLFVSRLHRPADGFEYLTGQPGAGRQAGAR